MFFPEFAQRSGGKFVQLSLIFPEFKRVNQMGELWWSSPIYHTKLRFFES